MLPKKLLFLTTNATWGGSEILWSRCAERFLKKGWEVKAGVYFDFDFIKNELVSEGNYFDLRKRFTEPGFFERVFRKLKIGRFVPTDLLALELRDNAPNLVIISQGNNKDGAGLMECCSAHGIPFITIIQLVSENLWPGLNDERIDALNILFQKSVANYFVSEHTRQMHEKILGTYLNNSKIIYNPFTKAVPDDLGYPAVKNETYKVALVGRLEIFHKGYDLLLDVVKEEKWQKRKISFAIFGQGPHKELLKRMISQSGINNIQVFSHNENVADIWKEFHILMMPSRMEGQSLSLIEAMRFKRAAIATDVGGVKELIEEGKSGFIAAYATAEHIDIALENAWQARESWQSLGDNAFGAICTRHPMDEVGFLVDEIEMQVS